MRVASPDATATEPGKPWDSAPQPREQHTSVKDVLSIYCSSVTGCVEFCHLRQICRFLLGKELFACGQPVHVTVTLWTIEKWVHELKDISKKA